VIISREYHVCTFKRMKKQAVVIRMEVIRPMEVPKIIGAIV